MDSDTETDYTDVTLSPAKDLDQPRSTIPKPLFSRSHNGFQSLPHSSSMKSRVSNSWEANNLMEEMTHGSHVAFHRSLSGKSPHSSTMDLDSLSARYAEDSLNFDLQEVAEEDSLAEEDLDLLEHDSLQPKAKGVDKKKLIIPCALLPMNPRKRASLTLLIVSRKWSSEKLNFTMTQCKGVLFP